MTRRRVCLFAPGQHVVGRDFDDFRGHPDTNRTIDRPTTANMIPLKELLANPRQFACVIVSRLDEELPAIFGFKDGRSWVVAFAPDQVDQVRATTADGQTVVLANSQNLAVGRAASRFTRIQWIDADGRISGDAVPTTPTEATIE